MARGGGQTQLLLIGPEPEMLELLEEILAEAGFGVHVVSDVSAIEDHLADPSYDAIVCDELPGELDGLMIFDALLESTLDRRPGFVLLSDTPDGERIARCLGRDMEEYVVKPFDVAELVARIDRVVRMGDRLAEARMQPSEVLVGDETIGFRGNLAYMNLPDLLMNLHQNGQTGILHVTVDDGDYEFSFNSGELLNAIGPRGLKSRKAFYRAMREAGGTFRFVVHDKVTGRRSSAFENVANAILLAVQEADEFPLTRRKLPPDPVPVSLSSKVDDAPLPENTAVQPLLEGLIKATTIDILIHACPKTDLEAAKELEELMMAEVLVQTEGSAAAAS